MRSELRADQIGDAARADLQFTVPTKPAVRLGVRFRRTGDLVVMDGADRAQAFSGLFAEEHLSAITERCDGTRTQAEIARAVDLDADLVYKSLALLWTAGAIEEAPATEGADADPHLAVLLSRLGNSTGANASWTDATTRLRTRSVSLVGDPALVAVARTALSGTCRLVEEDEEGEEGDLTVLFETGSTADAEREQAKETRTTLLRIRADAERILIGPYIDRSITACLTCGTQDDEPIAGPPAPELLDLVVGLASHHIVSLIARATTSHLPIDIGIVDLAALSMTYRPVLSRPGCPDCSSSAGPIATTPPVGAVYEASVALPPREFLSPRDHQAHYYTGNQQLQSQFRAWPSRRHEPLPPLRQELLPAEPWTGGRRALTKGLIGDVLGISFGIDAERSDAQRVRRWTASGGNIGCTTAYVILRDETVTARGVYAYAPDSHALVHLSDDVPPGPAPCELVITGELRKIMSKYGTFGLRLAFLDAGCNLASARAVSGHLGLGFRVISTWDDAELAAAIGVDPRKEPIAAVAELGGGADEK